MIDTVWEDFLKIARQEIGVRAVETWIKAVALYRYDASTARVYIKAPNAFVKDWMQTHYSNLFTTHLPRLLNVPHIHLVFTLGSLEEDSIIIEPKSTVIPARSTGSKEQENSLPSKPKIGFAQSLEGSRLNPSYTFSTFVVGQNNSFAYAAALAVVDKLGKLYNPLLFYGGSGLGKTHLLHAIGNEIIQKQPSKIVLYQTSDRFINEFINAIRFDKIHKFQAKYRAVDVLLIDDIQFMANKEQTQEAFFHIFNALYDEHKQIVFSSDVLPRHLGGLVDRLKSRLEWGLIADVQAPLLETKIAILKRKAELQGEELSDEAAAFIAQRFTTNVRELEGALIRVLAYASLTGQIVTIDIARKVLGDSAPQQSAARVEFNGVIKQVEKHYAYGITDLRSKNRSKDISLARQVAMYFMKKKTSKSLREIGDYLDRKDHTTITHAITRINQMRQEDKEFDAKMVLIDQELEASN